MEYPKIPYVVGQDKALLQCNRVADKTIPIRRALPGNVIVIHGVNDVGTSYKAIEDGLCAGLCTRLGRTFMPASYRQPEQADKDKPVPEPDPDAVFFKRKVTKETNSPIIPFYWGFRELRDERKIVNGQFTDRYGTRLDKDLSKGGGPFANATSTLPDMWNRGVYAPVDPGGDPLRPIKTAPGRMYMVLAAKRLAALISMIRDYDKGETVSIVAHSQGCMVTLLAQAMLIEQGLAPADTLILTHPPYSLEDELPWLAGNLEKLRGGKDNPMEPHYQKIDGRQTLHARLQTLINIVAGVARESDKPRTPEFSGLNNNCEHHGIVGSGWSAKADRDNRGKVYLYFSPEDMTVALENIQGIGWQGVPDLIQGTELKAGQETVFNRATGQRKPVGSTQYSPQNVTRLALQELGKGFRQRVFTAKQRPDTRTGKFGPVLVGLPTHDFALRLKGEDDISHMESSTRSLRAHHKVAQWPIDTKNSMAEQRNGIRTINGEPLPKPVVADLGRGQIAPKDVPKESSHAQLATGDQGPCEEVDPIDAAIAVSNTRLRVWVEERPDPTGVRQVSYRGTPQEITIELARMTEQYNKEKQLEGADAQRTIVRAFRLQGGRVIGHVQESPNEARLRWQREVSAKSFHGGIIGNAKNHEHVTAYDVAIGGGKASSDPKFYAYLCAVADWRLKKPGRLDKRRPGILIWEDFLKDFGMYWNEEPDWRSKLIEGNANYYSSGILPAGLPLLSGPLWSVVVSELKNGTRLEVKDNP